jgi:uncharacterized protein YjdB
MKRYGLIAVGAVLSITIFLSVSCGIDSYSYLPPVVSVNATLNSQAIISLPDAPDVITIDFSTGKPPNITIANQTKGLGSDYEIFYRIYLSDNMQPTLNTNTIRNTANPALATDWTAFEPYTVDSNNLSSSVLTAFTTRKYYSVLTDSSGNLMRSNGNGAFNPAPSDRLFMVSDELIKKTNISAEINADVQDKSGMTDAAQYVYTSMYIIMRGFDQLTLNPFYSAPTFVNVFMLPANVTLIPVTSVSLSPSAASASPACKLAAAVIPSNATNTGVTWSIDTQNNAAMIRVLENNTAIVSSLTGSGTARVTVTTNDGSYTASSDITLSGVAVQSIGIEDNTGQPISAFALYVNGAEELNAKMMPNNATLQGVTWSSSNTSVVTVSSNGIVTAKALGAAVITATTTDGTELTATCGVTVQ